MRQPIPSLARSVMVLSVIALCGVAWAQPMRRERGDRALRTSDVFQRAEALAQQGRGTEAAGLLEEEVSRDPTNAEAILALARTWQGLREWGKASECFEKAALFRGMRKQALFELAGVLALSGDKAGALEALGRAASAGFRNRAEAGRNPNLAMLYGDPRFEAWVDGGGVADDREGPEAGPGDRTAVLDSGAGEGLDRAVRGTGPDLAFSGSVLAVRESRVLIRKGYGLADRASGTPINADTLFPIGSMTRTFVAAAVLRLDQDGLLRLDDAIDRLIPEAPVDKRAITIRQVLSHTSGLELSPTRADEAAYGADDDSRERVLGSLLARPLAFEPGSMLRWSRANDALLAILIERVAKAPFEKAMRTLVLSRAGLSGVPFAGEPIDAGISVAVGYGAPDLPESPRFWTATPWDRKGSEGMLASARDLCAWAMAMNGDGVLNAAHRETMFTGYSPSARQLGRGQGMEGLGWFLGVSFRNTPAQVAWSEDDRGFAALLARYPEDGAIVVVLCNAARASEARDAVRRAIMQLVLSGAPAPTRPAIQSR